MGKLKAQPEVNKTQHARFNNSVIQSKVLETH